MEHEHAHVGARVARGERLPVRPDAEHGVGGPRVVLRDDRDLHDVHASSTCAASSRVTCSRSARNASASATATACG